MTDRSERLAERAEEAADISLGSAQVAKTNAAAAGTATDVAVDAARLALKAAKSVPVPVPVPPDPRDDPNFAVLAGPEQSWFARLSPRRSRWPDVAAVDAKIADLDQRQQALHGQLTDLHQRRQTADADAARRMADWLIDSHGERPQNEAQALDDQIADLSAEYQAIDIRRESVLNEKIALVTKRRRSLVRDAERAVDAAKKKYLDAVDAVVAARAELVDANQSRIWACCFPNDVLQTYPPDHVMVSGRRRESERNGFTSAVPATSIFGLLRDDAQVFTTITTRDQQAQMQGVSTAALSGDEAMWDDSDEAEAWRKRERERLRQAGATTSVDALALLEVQRHGVPPLGTQ